MHETVSYLHDNFCAAVALLVWCSAVIGGIHYHIEDWKVGRAVRHTGAWRMFSERVVVAGLDVGPNVFINDHLLTADSTTGIPDDAAKQIAYRNHVRCERCQRRDVMGYLFWQE